MKHLLHLEINHYETLVEALEELKKKGYTHSFKIERGKAICIETNEEIYPKNMMIVEYHRFEGETDPSDMAVVFAIECSNGTNGCIVDAYGTYSNENISEFLKKVNIAPRKD